MSFQKLKILIIDDCAEDRMNYKRLLKKDIHVEYIIIEADNGTDGVQLFDSEKPDCTLLDYNLPGTTGLEILDEIKTNNPNTYFPIVMLTGVSDVGIAVKALKEGAQDFLQKENLTPESIQLVIKKSIDNIQLINKTKELESIKADFLSTASHELRTPLTIIKEYIAIVNDEICGPVTEEQKECLTIAFNNCNRLSNLINDILDLQKLESNNHEIKRTKINIIELIENCRQDFDLKTKKKNQTLTVRAPQEEITVLCDYDKITQVLVNLLSNAHKFTPDNGTIEVQAELLGPNNEFVKITVKDSGIGMNEEDQKAVWDKFTQINRKDAPGIQGTGLGLAIVKNIISLHDGEVDLISELNNGSSFIFTVPIYSNYKKIMAHVEDKFSNSKTHGNDFSVIIIKGNNYDKLSELHQDIIEQLRKAYDCSIIDKVENTIIVTSEVDSDGIKGLRKRIEKDIKTNTDISIWNTTINSEDTLRNSIKNISHEIKNINYIENPTKRVLIVYDDIETLNIIETALEESDQNLRITTITSGYDACINFSELAPDIVFLAINIPGFDGEQVIDQLKKTARWVDIKVIIISGDKLKCLEMVKCGADDYLTKPFNIDDLIEMTKKLSNNDYKQEVVEKILV